MLLMHKVFLKILFLIPVIGYANDPFEEIERSGHLMRALTIELLGQLLNFMTMWCLNRFNLQ